MGFLSFWAILGIKDFDFNLYATIFLSWKNQLQMQEYMLGLQWELECIIHELFHFL
jgi:hypothetical protein